MPLELDLRAVTFAALLTGTTGVLIGLVPLVQLTGVNARGVVRSAGSTGTEGGTYRTKRSIFVIAEITIALILTTGTWLLTTSYLYTQRLDLGYDAKRLATTTLEFSSRRYDDPVQVRTAGEQVLNGLNRAPGVSAAAIWQTTFLNLKSNRPEDAPLTREAQGEQLPRGAFPILLIEGSTGIFQTVGLRAVRGRLFSTSDSHSAPAVAVVNEEAARQLWPGEDPLGRRFKLGPPHSASPWLTVVGVTADAGLLHPDALGLALVRPTKRWPQVYRPLAQTAPRRLTAAVRTEGDPSRLIPVLRAVVREVDEDVFLENLNAFQHTLSSSWKLGELRLQMRLLLSFTIVGTFVALVGIYGIVADSVQRRTREIGIRMALGAREADVMRFVVRDALRLGVMGVSLGLAGAAILSNLFAKQLFGLAPGHGALLYGVSPSDPRIFAAACVTLLLVVASASYLPARRATRIDPMTALRHE